VTVATFDLVFPSGGSAELELPGRSTGRGEGVVISARSNARAIRRYSYSNRNATEGEAWRLMHLWDLTFGALDLDFTDPESGAALRVTFSEEPKWRRVSAVRWELEAQLEEAL